MSERRLTEHMKLKTEELVDKYNKSIYALAFSICKNNADAQDIVQDTFIKYHLTNIEFESEEHIKAWLFRVAINKSKNVMKSFWKKSRVSFEDYINEIKFENDESKGLFEEVMKLPEKYRIVIHLFYYEDYSVKEISHCLKISESNVCVRLNRARKMLKEKVNLNEE